MVRRQTVGRPQTGDIASLLREDKSASEKGDFPNVLLAPGVVYLLILLHLFIYIVAALVVRKNHKLTVPLSAEAAAKRSSRILLGWVLALLGIGVVVFGFFIILSGQSNSPYIPIGVALIVAGFVTLIVGAVLGSRAANILAAKKITEHATWFKGADPAYVRRFPPMPPFPSH